VFNHYGIGDNSVKGKVARYSGCHHTVPIQPPDNFVSIGIFYKGGCPHGA